VEADNQLINEWIYKMLDEMD